MKYMKNKYGDENGNVISFWSTDDNVLCKDNKTLRENLNNKADKNSVFTMANMGQDIKDAMTGGSVAVVGKNTILTDNIVDGQVTPYKTNFVEYGNNILNIDELVDGYVYSNGEIKNGNYVTTTYIPFSKGDKINLSRMDNPTQNTNMTRRAIRTACFYDSSYTILTDYYYDNASQTKESVTYQGTGNVAYIRVSFQKTLVDNAMLYLGEERKEYEKNGVMINKLLLNENLKEEIETKVKIDNNVLKNKTILNFGDSISAGDGNNGVGYAELLAKKNNMTCYDYAVGGATITTSTNDILTQIEKAKNDKKTADYILFDGFTNDINKGAVKELGKISDGYGQTKNVNTFSGAFEEICYRLKTYWKGIPIFYVCVHKMSSRDTALQKTYSERAKTLCERWSIPVIDIYGAGGLNTYIADYKTFYTNNADGTHPNELGYNTFYVPLIEKILKSGITSSTNIKADNKPIKVHFLARGGSKGDCSLICAEDKNILIDVGNEKKCTNIVSYLKSINILRIDGIIISHFHHDHTGGINGECIADLLDNTEIDTSNCVFYLPHKDIDYTQFVDNVNNGVVATVSGTDAKVKEVINNRHLTIIYPTENSIIKLGENTEIKFLNLSTDYFADYYNYTLTNIDTEKGCTCYNNFSMVCELIHCNSKILFTGDIEKKAQEKIKSVVSSNIDVYKVEHHALNKSTDKDFLYKINPKNAVVLNTDTMPWRMTVYYLYNTGCNVYDVNTSGNVVATMNDNNVYVDSDNGVSKINYGFNTYNFITVRMSSNYTTTSTDVENLTLETIVSSKGDRLSLENGKIIIGANISTIKISGQVGWASNGEGATYEGYIYKNDTAQIRSSMTSNNTYYTNTLPSKIINVTEGDVISLCARSRTASGAIVASNTDQTWLSIEVIL